jgi:hypothetical protein
VALFTTDVRRVELCQEQDVHELDVPFRVFRRSPLHEATILDISWIPVPNSSNSEREQGGALVTQAAGRNRIIGATRSSVPAVARGELLTLPRRHRSTAGVRPTDPTVSVVIPTLNEADNLPFTLSTLADIECEVIVVDGRSTDDTVRVACALHADVLVVREERKGKGAALQAGFAAASGDIIVMLDADGSADGREIPAFVQVLKNGADFAKGTRFATDGGSADITLFRHAGNKGLNAAVNGIFGSSYTDLCYGYNAFWRDCLPYLSVDCDGFEVETLMNIRAIRSGLRIVEVPSYESARIHGRSNLRAIRDGLRVARTIGQEARRQLDDPREFSQPPARPAHYDGQRTSASVDAPRHRLCLVAPGQHAPVLGVVSDHASHALGTDWEMTSIQLSVPDDPYDWTLLGLNTPSLVTIPHLTEVVSRPSAFRSRRVRRFLLRHAPDVVLLDLWSVRQIATLLRIARTARGIGIKVAVRVCGRLDETVHPIHRGLVKALLRDTDLLVTQGFVPKLVQGASCPVFQLPEWKTEERQVDPNQVRVIAFLPSNDADAGEMVLTAFAGLSEGRAAPYQLELATRAPNGLTRLEAAIANHHHADKITLIVDLLSDHELHRRVHEADVAIVFEPDVSSRALEIAEVRGIPVVTVRADGTVNESDAYCGATVSPAHPASILAAIERATLARRFRYPDSRRWRAGADRLSARLAELVSEPT